jgi:hypothetical protein
MDIVLYPFSILYLQPHKFKWILCFEKPSLNHLICFENDNKYVSKGLNSLHTTQMYSFKYVFIVFLEKSDAKIYILRKEAKLVLFCTPTSPKQSHVKNKTSLNFFSTIGLILKTLNKIYEKIFYSVGFTKPTL